MQRLVDRGERTFQIAINLIVPEPQYPQALADLRCCCSFDRLVSEREQIIGDAQPKRLCCFQVDKQFEFGRP